MSGVHSSHRTRMSDASSFDEKCIYCGRTDEVPGGFGLLEQPCPVTDKEKELKQTNVTKKGDINNA